MALACGFPIPVEGFAVPGLAADLLEAATVFFAADRVGAIVFFWVARADIALAEVFAVGLCPCLSEPAFFSWAGFTALAPSGAASARRLPMHCGACRAGDGAGAIHYDWIGCPAGWSPVPSQ